MNKLTTALLGGAFLLAATTASAQATSPAPVAPAPAAATAAAPASVPQLVRTARTAYEAKDYRAYRDALAAIHAQRPWNGDYMYQLVLANALLGERSAAYEIMLKMQGQGLSYDFNAVEESASLRGTQAYDYVSDLLVRQGEPAGEARPLFDLPVNLLLPTSIAWDASRERLLVGDAREGTVHAVDMEGGVRELLRVKGPKGAWGVYGLTVDVPGNRLWVSATAGPATASSDPSEAGHSALLEYALDSLEPVRSYAVPADGKPHRLAGMVRVPNGDLYAVDSVLPIIYRLASGAQALVPFVASGDMVSLRGITASADGQRLYVADYEMGVMVIDLAQKRVGMLELPANFNPGGIEGLLGWEGHLVAIQNGLRPQRVMRLELDADGLKVTGVAPLAVAQPIFDRPNFGTMVGDELVFLANSHWVRAAQGQPKPVTVASTNVRNARTLVSPDMQKFIEEARKHNLPVPATDEGQP